MTAPKLRVGAAARVVEVRGLERREVYRTTIARETPMQWVDVRGSWWRKRDGSHMGYTTMRREIEPIPEGA